MVELEVREFLRLTVVRGGRHLECSFQACHLRSCWLKFSRRYIRVSFPLAQVGIGRWWRHDAHTHTHTLNYFTHAHILANIFAVTSFLKSSLFCSESQHRSSQKVHIAVATLQKPTSNLIHCAKAAGASRPHYGADIFSCTRKTIPILPFFGACTKQPVFHPDSRRTFNSLSDSQPTSRCVLSQKPRLKPSSRN